MNDESLEASIRATLSQYAGGLIDALRKNLNLAELGYNQNPDPKRSESSGISVKSYELCDLDDRFIGDVDIETRDVGDAVLIRVTYVGAFPRAPIQPEEKYDTQRQFELIAKNTLQPFETATVVSEWDREDKYLGIPLVYKIPEKKTRVHAKPAKPDAGMYRVSDVAEEKILIESTSGSKRRKVDADDDSAMARIREAAAKKKEEADIRDDEEEARREARLRRSVDLTIDAEDMIKVDAADEGSLVERPDEKH